MLRYDLVGLLSNAADTLDALSARKHPHAGGEAFAVREVADNIEKLFQDRALWDQFAQIYSLTPADIERRASKAAAPSTPVASNDRPSILKSSTERN